MILTNVGEFKIDKDGKVRLDETKPGSVKVDVDKKLPEDAQMILYCSEPIFAMAGILNIHDQMQKKAIAEAPEGYHKKLAKEVYSSMKRAFLTHIVEGLTKILAETDDPNADDVLKFAAQTTIDLIKTYNEAEDEFKEFKNSEGDEVS